LIKVEAVKKKNIIIKNDGKEYDGYNFGRLKINNVVRTGYNREIMMGVVITI
jgi:hypothetical protein